MSPRVLFLGPPGAGKGTQAHRLADEWGVPHVATGDMLRDAVARDTPLGRQARRHMEAGELVPDAVVIGLVGERLGQADAASGFVLDGFPRTVAQAQALDRMLEERQIALDRVVFFEVSRDELLRRLTGRRVCRTCASTYHLASAPPKTPGRCDRCGGQLIQRDDDTEAAVATRLDVYERQTQPLLAYYAQRGLLARVTGEGDIGRITAEVRLAVRAAA